MTVIKKYNDLFRDTRFPLSGNQLHMKNPVSQIVRICPLGAGPLSEASKNNFPLNVDIKATDHEADY